MRKLAVGVATTICIVLGLPAAAAAAPTWSPVSPISESGANSMDTAMGSNGDVAATWVGFVAGTPTAQLATRSPSGSFSAPLDLSPPGNESSNASQVAEDAAGEATVVWNSSVKKSNYIMEAATVKDGVISTPVKLSAPGQNAVVPRVAVNDRGDAIVAWARNNGTDEIVQASFRLAGGNFGAPVNLSTASGNAAPASLRVAIDAAGDATVVWEWSNGGAVDQAFSTPTVSWSFGDAASASGDSVTQTFTNPGTYSVSVTAPAAPGDSATHTGTITVVAPAPPVVPVFQAATLGTSTVTADNHGRVHLQVACPAGAAACAGTVALTLPATASALAVAARAQGTPVTVTAGNASFSAAAGAATTVTIALPAPVLQLLKRHHHLTFTIALESHNASGPSVTTGGKVLIESYVKPKKPKRAKKKK